MTNSTINKFNVWTESSVHAAKVSAKAYKHRTIGTGHLLLGVVDRGLGVSKMMEQNFMVSVMHVDIAVSHLKMPVPDGIGPDFMFTIGAQEVCELAEKLSHQHPIEGGWEVHPQHLMAAILHVDDKHTKQVMLELRIESGMILRQLAMEKDS